MDIPTTEAGDRDSVLTSIGVGDGALRITLTVITPTPGIILTMVPTGATTDLTTDTIITSMSM